jgi:UDP-3-O-[3-hydroxymyristoyl] glucosamine N-acyltransferase
MSKLKQLIAIAIVPLPWRLRRAVLNTVCGYKIDRTAKISRWALLLPARLEVGAHAYIGAFTVCKGLTLLKVEESGWIGALNWITAFPEGTGSRHFADATGRKPQLIVERHAAITNRHLIDCTDEVSIGAFTTFAGFRSQILTHSIDLKESRQRAKPVRIGHHCFVGTGCVLLGGSVLPDCSVLGAQSLLNERHETPHYLYGGVPAKPIKPIDPEAQYFSRTSGYVW